MLYNDTRSQYGHSASYMTAYSFNMQITRPAAKSFLKTNFFRLRVQFVQNISLYIHLAQFYLPLLITTIHGIMLFLRGRQRSTRGRLLGHQVFRGKDILSSYVTLLAAVTLAIYTENGWNSTRANIGFQ